jgi:DNA helicase-2/ATP-dependent DNA helicase PcrA
MPFTPTPEQRAILRYALDRHARVLAGPGTGKSATIVKLLNDIMGRPEPPRVKLLTFTRAATAELAHKVSEHPAVAAERPSTIHSFALSILLRNPDASSLPRPIRIADDWERKNVVNKTLGRRIGVQPRRIDNLFRELAANWEALNPAQSNRIRPQDRARFMGGWTEHRAIFGYTMLSEIPYGVREALLAHGDLDGIDFDLLMVDEYQDLNACDLEVLRLLAERGCWIISVGDDDQSIYSFRRAAPEGIRRFPTDYAGCAQYPLSVTHRCGSHIIDWAAHIIEGDVSRDPDRPRLTPAKDSPPGEVGLLAFGSAQAEATGVAQLVDNLIHRERIAAEDILILLRGDYQGSWSAPIKEALAARAIAYADPESVTEVLDRPANRSALALLRILLDREDSLAWATLFELQEGIGNSFMDAIYDLARAQHATFGQTVLALHTDNFPGAPVVSARRASNLVTLVLKWLETHPVPEEIPDEGWTAWLVAQLTTIGLFEPDHDLTTLLFEVEEFMEPYIALDRYLNQVAPAAKDLAYSRSTGVRIMSMAASKGLTVEATILPGLEDGVMPRPDADREEERRLLYVAMTRSKKYLFGTWAKRRQGPTARSGRAAVQQRRLRSSFLLGGPIGTQDGEAFIAERWPRD